MSPVSTQEFVSDAQSLLTADAIAQDVQETAETARKVRASFTMLSLAFSLGVSGSFLAPAEAADSMQLAALPSVSGSAGTLPSFGSNRPNGATATYHTVANGETIWDIAESHGVSVEDIKVANGIEEGQIIQAGQVLKVPAQAGFVDSAATEPSVVVVEPSPDIRVQDLARLEADRPVDTQVTVEHLEREPEASISLTEFLQARQDTASTALSAEEGHELAVAPQVSANTEDISSSVPEEEAVRSLGSALPDTIKREETKSVLAALVQLPSPATDALEASSPTAEATVHEVASGETLWSIARQYGTEPAQLERFNEIEDPSRLAPGDRVLVPMVNPTAVVEAEELSALSAQVEAEESPTATALEVDPVEAAIVRLPQREVVHQTQVSAAELAPEASVAPAVNETVEVSATQTTDPFIASLLSDVTGEATVAQVVSPEADAVVVAAEPGETAIETPTVAFSERPAVVTDKSVPPEETVALEETVVNVEFSPGTETASLGTGTEAAQFSPEELLAVAPLGSEVYAPVVAPVPGQVVSPDMPVLPAQDQFLPEAPARFNGYMWPAQGVLTSGYGWRWGRMHRGIDIAGPVGTPIYAAAAGTVVRSGWNSGGYGNLVDIRHEDGSLTRYAHNSRLLVNEGQRVTQGQQIAEMGSTGYSTGPHLHFEIHAAGQGAVNPMAYLSGR